MKNPIKLKWAVACKPTVYNGVDSHQWAHKMEMRRLVSSKPKVLDKLRKRRNDII